MGSKLVSGRKDMISISRTLRSTVTLCAILTTGIAVAQDGVVRMSDRGGAAGATGQSIRQVAHSRQGDSCGVQGCAPGCQAAEGCSTGTACNSGMGCDPCMACDPCQGTCYLPTDCNHIFAPVDASGMPAAWCRDCGCSPCQCMHGRRRDGRSGRACRDMENTLFARPVDSGTGSGVRDLWHGHSMSFRNKNARLADRLFGWMVPSGCCGQGCPPVGHYSVTYADQPDYIDQRDTQLYGAQGYGMPMTVPLAPNVNHAYNYSAGLPASRVTHIGNYNPQTSVQPLYHQSW
jgi:hypothetical protein